MAQMYFLGNTTHWQMLGFVIKTKHKTIVIDGGVKADSEQLAELLRKKANSHVDAWFFTHPHSDHIGAFLEICKNNSEIKIDNILYNFPSIELLKKYGNYYELENNASLWQEFENLMSSRFSDSFCQIKRGDVFEFDDIKVNILRVFNEKITSDFNNNSSCVCRIDSPKTKVLVLGDLGADGGKDVMQTCSAQSLWADYTQIAHHGQNGVEEDFYEYIRPQKCLWSTPEWLWNNDDGGGIDSGPWATMETRKWMQKLGVTEHIVTKDGTVEILI